VASSYETRLRREIEREETRAFAWFVLIVYGLAALLLLAVAAVRDQAVIHNDLSRPDPIECVAERYAAGATHEIAVELCGGIDPEGLERDLP